jgi:hypothetical protein
VCKCAEYVEEINTLKAQLSILKVPLKRNVSTRVNRAGLLITERIRELKQDTTSSLTINVKLNYIVEEYFVSRSYAEKLWYKPTKNNKE